jgi:1,4-dihydroxy-2-naphthoate octaprenyltransferase
MPKRVLAWPLRHVVLRRAGLDRCRQLLVGSAPIGMDLLESFRSLGVEIHNAFGVTEAPLITLSRLGANELGSVGSLLPDTEARIGPERATAQGWLSPQQTLMAPLASVCIAATCGLALVGFGGVWMLAVGIVRVIACLAYSLGPFPLAYHGLGDVFVLVFFGLVAVAFTTWTQALEFPPFMWLVAFACGFGANNILLINNLRDRETDARAGKRTTVVRFGKGFANGFYKFNLVFLFLSPLALRFIFGMEALCILLPMVVLPWMMGPILKTLQNYEDPRELNPLLGKSAQLLLVYALLQSLGLFVQAGGL